MAIYQRLTGFFNRSAATKRGLRSMALMSLLLGGCATTVPGPPVPPGIDLSNAPAIPSVIQSPESFQNQGVRWGGNVVSVNNQNNSTLIEIIGRPLVGQGQPDLGRPSNGRFIAEIPGFVDPADYTKDSAITVIGNIDGSINRKIGDADYEFPKVTVASHQLWNAVDSRFSRRAAYRGYGYGYGGYGLGLSSGVSAISADIEVVTVPDCPWVLAIDAVLVSEDVVFVDAVFVVVVTKIASN